MSKLITIGLYGTRVFIRKCDFQTPKKLDLSLKSATLISPSLGCTIVFGMNF